MLQLSKTVKLTLLGIGLPTFLGLLYFLLRSSGDHEEEIGKKKKSTEATARQTVIEMKIPRKAVGAVIGRQGAMIKEIQEESGAKVNFKDDTEGDEDRTAIIRGTSEAAQRAECMIRKVLADMPVIVEEQMLVPQYALGRIIGRGGESIRQMSRASKTRILVDRTRDSYRNKPQIITIVGPKQQIDVAKGLIQEKLDEEEVFRAKQAVSAANRQTRNQARDVHHGDNNEVQTDGEPVANTVTLAHLADWEPEKREEENVKFPSGREYIEVYVSAIANPDHFWVQLIGSMALQLDKLSETMTRFYENEGKDMTLPSVKQGDIVAAPFENDTTWYRARVMEVFDDNRVDLFYVDYGDSAYMDRSLVKPLSGEYLSLPFQAIECRLSGVKASGEWNEDSFDKFEQLTHCAKWKRILAKATKFTGSVPHLILIDTNTEKDVNINEEMIRSGFAVVDT